MWFREKDAHENVTNKNYVFRRPCYQVDGSPFITSPFSCSWPLSHTVRNHYTQSLEIVYRHTLFRSSRTLPLPTNKTLSPVPFLCILSDSKLLGDHTGYNTQGQLLRQVVSSLRNPMQCNAQSDVLVLVLKRLNMQATAIYYRKDVWCHIRSFSEREFNDKSRRFHSLVFQLVRATNKGRDFFFSILGERVSWKQWDFRNLKFKSHFRLLKYYFRRQKIHVHKR